MGDTSQIYWRHWHWYLSIGKMMINTGIGFHFSRTRPQPFAWGPHGRAYGKFCKRGHFWVFPASRSCVSRGRRGTSWHSNVFRNVSKVVVCVAGAILLRRFQKMRCSFRGRRSTLDVPIVILRGRRSTLGVACCVFFANRIVRAASKGDKVQIPWHARRFVRCDEKLTDASHETSILRLQIFRF